jgi:hypothetical protein
MSFMYVIIFSNSTQFQLKSSLNQFELKDCIFKSDYVKQKNFEREVIKGNKDQTRVPLIHPAL